MINNMPESALLDRSATAPPAPPTPRREAIKPPESSGGRPEAEVNRLAAAVLNRKINQFQELRGAERSAALQSRENQVLDSLSGLANPKTGLYRNTEGRGADGSSLIGTKSNPEPESRWLKIKRNGKVYSALGIEEVTGDRVLCTIRDESDSGKSVRHHDAQNPQLTTFTRQELVNMELIAEADTILSTLSGAEKTIVEIHIANLRNSVLGESNPVPAAAQHAALVREAVDSIGVPPTIDDLVAYSDRNLQDEPIPTTATPEQKAEIEARNQLRQAQRNKVKELKDSGVILPDYRDVAEIIGGEKSFRKLADQVDKDVQYLESRVILQVGAVVPASPDGSTPAFQVTQQMHDEWRRKLTYFKTQQAVYRETRSNQAGGLLETFFRKAELGQILPEEGQKIRKLLIENNIAEIAEIATAIFDREARAASQAELTAEQKESRRKHLLEASMNVAKYGGGLMAFLLLFGIMQGMKEGK